MSDSQLPSALLRRVESVIAPLEALRARALAMEAEFADDLAEVAPSRRESARNLLHYLALRQGDLRELQKRLGALGLSRLGRCEAHVLSSIDAVLDALYALAARTVPPRDDGCIGIDQGARLLQAHAVELMGDAPMQRYARIMVTMPSEAATAPQLVHELCEAGMSVMRINCAHDDPHAWLKMIEHARAAEHALGHRCYVYADLAGPKLRTGALAAADRVVSFAPRRDLRGAMTRPARVWLAPRGATSEPHEPVQAELPLHESLLAEAEAGDLLEIDDARGFRRAIRLVERRAGGWIAESSAHVYVADRAGCGLLRDGRVVMSDTIGPLPDVVLPLVLCVGDILHLTSDQEPGGPPRLDPDGGVLAPAVIPCTLPEVFAAAQPGQPIWFDDGKIGGVIRDVQRERISVEITHAARNGSKLRPGKGINLPDTRIDVPALTDKDLADLAALAPHVDIVGLSFVRDPQDVVELDRHLKRLGAQELGIVLKIETRQAFENLPRILLAALRSPPVGVMVARGDLAVEVGFERLAELQEEIVWLCEAAHVPVIWATQVLENMAKKGMPSRAEVSDAAMSVEVECVMLNKGPYVVETVRFLRGVLERMSGHTSKRQSMLRRLSVSQSMARAHAPD
jgi:pyruvate kinase